MYVTYHVICYTFFMRKVSFYVGEQQWEHLQAIARMEGRQTSEMARQAISELIRSYKTPFQEKQESEKGKGT